MQDLNPMNFPAKLPLTSRQLGQLKQELIVCVPSSDLFRLTKRAGRFAQSSVNDEAASKEWKSFQGAVTRAHEKVLSRQKNIPKIRFPDLPVSARSEEIRQLIKDSQVVIIAGETGSGKTTQIPKICLQAGRGVKGIIGHTQPRRIAARTVANRIAEELESPLGKAVGYKVRFADQTSPDSYIKLMTDGILLAEIQQDRFLSKYDTLIIDEAHERSLNIDFLLGYLKTLLVQRKDLKLIITSATIDIQKFSAHFNDAPIVEVSGRTYPVDIIYSDLDILEGDRNQQIVDCLRNIQDTQEQGDVLVFLSGEREIREASLALRRAQFPNTEIAPLYARLSLAEQSKIFSPHKGRRVILSTNVAETSLTVPGIRYVIDTGRARVSRYSFRTKVQRLPIEAISQASANQRAGRCGRVSDGVCFRLYRQDDFDGRPEFTDPEIVRTNLAAVILQMLQLRLGDIRDFPFIDPPDSRLINDGYKLLEELQAVTADGNLTAMGKKLVTLPVDPRFARMIVESDKNGSLNELVVITSGLSIQDPRERPGDKQQAADQAHKQWADQDSDFVSLLNLWNHFEEKRRDLSTNQYSKYCRSQYVSFIRMREWRDLHHQLHSACRALSLKENQQSADYASVHRSLLSGLLGQIGIREEKWEFLGTRNRKFFIFPGSGLSKKPPKWVMAGSLMETTKQYALNAAKIDSAWLESLAAHLVKKTHSEPFYHHKSGQVMASERQTLFGLSIVEGKKVVYGNINASEARKVFIQQALVEEGYRGKGAFYAHNHALVSELQALEDRFRRRDLLAEQMVIFSHYDERVPATVCNLPAFEKWRKTAEKSDSKLLFMSKESLLLRGLSDSEEAQFPEVIIHEGFEFDLRYHFEPGHPEDGVNLLIPLAILHQLPHYLFQWLVPGMLRDKCIALIKGLPKQIRRQFVPVPDYVDKILLNVSAQDRPLTVVLSEQLQRLTGIKIEEASWNSKNLDNWYQMNFVLQNDKGQLIAMARSLHRLQGDFKQQIKQSLGRPSEQSIARKGVLEWDFDQLPVEVELPRGDMTIKAWPALQDNGESASIELVDNPLVAQQISRHGQLRLALLKGKEQHKYLSKNLLRGEELALKAAGVGPRDEIVTAIIEASFQQAIFSSGVVIRDRDYFENSFSTGISHVVDIAQRHAVQIGSVLAELHEQQKRLRGLDSLALDAQLDIASQVSWLFSSDTLRRVKPENTQQYPRFVKGISIRIDKLTSQVVKDREYIIDLRLFADGVEGVREKQQLLTSDLADSLLDFQWLLEEYRISLFAQQLKTRVPVSAKRLAKRWSDILNQLKILLPDYH
jgi:ATP-dependent helicase HrpA